MIFELLKYSAHYNKQSALKTKWLVYLFWTLKCFSNISGPFADRKDVAGVGYIAAFFNDVVTTHVHIFTSHFVVLIIDEYHVGGNCNTSSTRQREDSYASVQLIK